MDPSSQSSPGTSSAPENAVLHTGGKHGAQEPETSTSKSKRMVGKQRGPAAVAVSATQHRLVRPGETSCSVIGHAEGCKCEAIMNIRRKLWSRLRDEFVRQRVEEWKRKCKADENMEDSKAPRTKFKKQWGQSSAAVKAQLAEKIMNEIHETTIEWKLLRDMVEKFRDGHDRRMVNAKSCLLTWNGDWGIMDQHSEVSQGTRMPELVEAMRNTEQAKVLWSECQAYCQGLHESLRAPIWSLCLELCKRTWETRGVLRLHLHIFLASPEKLRTRREEVLEFRGTLPVRSGITGSSHLSGKSRCRINDSGDFYVQCPKVGQLWSQGCRAMFEDFQVKPGVGYESSSG